MKKVLFVLSLLIYSINVFSQQNDEVTLVVSADGSTKEEATKNAPKPVTTEDLLTEIRDLLKSR